MGNDALVETVRTMPNRYASLFSDEEEVGDGDEESGNGEEDEEENTI